MPKRQRIEKYIAKYKRKLQKYEEMAHHQTRTPNTMSASASASPPSSDHENQLPFEDSCDENITENNDINILQDSATQGESTKSDDVILIDIEDDNEELDEEFLSILGNTENNAKYGPKIHKELASRWTNLIKSGLSRERCKEIEKKYIPPENCKNIDAPKLNLEAQVAVSEQTLKRDKSIFTKQQQTGCALTALAMGLDLLLKNKDNVTVVNYISDAAQLLCDLQHHESVIRRNFILQSLDQHVRDSVKDSEIDQWLFGENFSEKLKATRAIRKSGHEIKLNKNKKPQQATYLNSRGPFANHPRSRTYRTGLQRTPQAFRKHTRVQQMSQVPKTYNQYKAPLRLNNNRN